MSDERQRGSLRKVGALWKPKPGSKSLGSGSITVNGLKQRFVILRNDRKNDGSSEPDYLLLSSDEPAKDEYAQRRPVSASAAGLGAERSGAPFEATIEDVPF
jgi:hypothetical protein